MRRGFGPEDHFFEVRVFRYPGEREVEGFYWGEKIEEGMSVGKGKGKREKGKREEESRSTFDVTSCD